MKCHVVISNVVELADKEAEDICLQYLEILKENRWTRADGKVYEEHVTSHRFDVEVGSASDPQFAILVAAEKLQKLLKDRRDSKKK